MNQIIFLCCNLLLVFYLTSCNQISLGSQKPQMNQYENEQNSAEITNAKSKEVIALLDDHYNHYIQQQYFIDINEAKKKWGQQEWSNKAWKGASLDTKAALAVDILQNKYFIGKKENEIIEALGRQTGFFYSDYIPAYIIQKGIPGVQDKKETWQLVVFSNDEQVIEEIKIHRQ
jgi:hypothetical protein